MGYHLSEDQRADGPVEALKMAVRGRKYGHDLIHHSDRGLQYCSEEYQRVLEKAQLKPSLTEKHDPYQNAVAERVNGILKDEFALGWGFAHHLEAAEVIAESVGIYNSQRPHLSCHYLTPESDAPATGTGGKTVEKEDLQYRGVGGLQLTCNFVSNPSTYFCTTSF